MKELAALDLHFMEKELKVLEGGFMEKIYQWSNDQFIFRISTKEGKKLLRVVVPGAIFLTSKPYDADNFPSGFSQYLRKHISNRKIVSVRQHEFERIMELEFQDSKLIFELFKPGNIVLTDAEGQILNALTRQKFKDREITPKTKYQYPPGQFNLKEGSAEDQLKDSSKAVGKAIATELGLGGKYSDHIIKQSGLDKSTPANKLNAKSYEKLQNSIKEVLSQDPEGYIAKGEAFPISIHDPDKKFMTFSEAIDELADELVVRKDHSAKAKKAELVLETQLKRLAELKKEIDENRKKGEYIYEHYKEFEQLLQTIKSLRKTKSFREIKEILKKNKHFKELNEKNKTITLEF